MIKRIAFFIMTNLALMVTVSIIAMILGINPRSNDLISITIYSGIFGFMSAFMSLALSRISAKWMTGAKVITNPSNQTEAWLVKTVEQLILNTNIKKMPEVAIYHADDVNAFATGPTKNRSLVAVSTGLLNNMNESEVRAVLAHEIAHIENGDMVTMTLIMGVVNTVVLIVSRLLTNLIVSQFKIESSVLTGFIYIAIQIVIGIFSNLIVMYFSRKREYRADAGAARLVGNNDMINALVAIERSIGKDKEVETNKNLATLSISSNNSDSLWSTHPTIENRINALRNI